MEVITLFKPLYWLAGYLKVVTAVASIVTAISLPRLVPRIIRETAAAALAKKSQDRFQALLDSTQHPMVITNAESTITLVNSQMEEAFGYSREELLGQKFETVIGARFRNEHADYSASFFNEPQSIDAAEELMGLKKNGDEFPIEISLDQLQTDEGTLITTTIRDITLRKRAESNFTQLLEANPDPTVVVDRNRKIILANAHLCRLFGYPCEEILSRQIDMLIPEGFRGVPLIHGTGVYAKTPIEAEMLDVEVYGLRKDGTIFPIEISLRPLDSEDGIMVASVIRDLTEQKLVQQRLDAQTLKLQEQAELLETMQKLGQSEEALQSSERRYRALFDENPQPMYVYDLGTLNFLDVNEATLLRYGYSRKEFLALTIHGIRPAEEVPKIVAEIERRRTSPFFEKEGSIWKHKTKSGEIMDMSVVIHMIDIDGRPALLCVAQDIGDKQRSQEQLQESQKLEAIGQLAGGVAHDFNNLLGVIMGQAELLNEKLVDEDLRGRASSIIRAADHGASLTHQLLAFSRKQLIEPIVLSLNALVAETIQLLGRTLGEEIELVTRLAGDLWLVNADAGQIQQVLLNLALNARDAMPNGGTLTITTENTVQIETPKRREGELPLENHILLTVNDTGEGMTDDVRERIFEPFFTTKPAGKGTGLGLAMVYGIVKQNNGHILVTSEPNSGTTFKIYLPRTLAEPAMSRRSAVPAWGSETILVVEDQTSLRETVSEMLKDYGYTVLEASNGKEALHIVFAKKGEIDLVITDVIMPEMSGTKLARCLQAIDSPPKLLFISGYTGEEVYRQGGLGKNVGFLQKPFSPTALVARVRQVLDRV